MGNSSCVPCRPTLYSVQRNIRPIYVEERQICSLNNSSELDSSVHKSVDQSVLAKRPLRRCNIAVCRILIELEVLVATRCKRRFLCARANASASANQLCGVVVLTRKANFSPRRPLKKRIVAYAARGIRDLESQQTGTNTETGAVE